MSPRLFSFLLFLLLFASGRTWAIPEHRWGCDMPLENTRLCWESSGPGEDFPMARRDLEAGPTPYEWLHLFPMLALDDPDGVLVDYSRAIHRQLSGSGLAMNVRQEWKPARTIDEAQEIARRQRWPTALLIEARLLRESSASSTGVVDLQFHLLDGDKGMIVRTTRIRVESHPSIQLNYDAILTAMGVMDVIGMAAQFGTVKAVGMLAKLGAGTKGPPQAGHSLELLSETVIRQLIHILRTPLDQLGRPR